MIEICLDKPLVPKRPPSSLAKRYDIIIDASEDNKIKLDSINSKNYSLDRVSEYIPPRSIFPTRVRSAKKTLETYHKQVAHVAKLVLNEYRLLNKGVLRNHYMPQDTEIVDERYSRLMFQIK